jgi:hypothetical protein
VKQIKFFPLLLAIFIQGCSYVRDHVVEPTPEVPAAVQTSIKAKYPAASDMKFSVLEEDKVYKAEFKDSGTQTSVVANNTEILNTARVSGDDFYSSFKAILSGLAIEGGVFSNYRVMESAGNSSLHVTDYLLNGIKYTLTINTYGAVQMSTRELSYETKSLTDLPESIQKFINDRSKPNPTYVASLQLDDNLKAYIADRKELTYRTGSVYLLNDGKKRYQINVSYYGLTELQLLFDENATLVWVANFNRIESFKNFDTLTGGLTKLSASEIAAFQNIFNATPQYQNFTLGNPVSNPNASLNVYGGLTSYEFQLTKPRVNGNGDEVWNLQYDANKNLIGSIYSAP